MTTGQSLEPQARPIPPIVLVVTDDPLTLEMCERLLGIETQHELWVTGSAQVEAIEYARDLWPDIIVSDLDLRIGANGPALLGDLRAMPKLEQVPVVLVAAVEPDARIVQLVDRVLLKPIDPVTFLAEVRDVLEYSKHLRARSSTLRRSITAVLARSQRVLNRSGAVKEKRLESALRKK